jgi:lipopolysaccharide/colanic/teichoic acid biosynthesis glycosyltransferase
MSTTAQTLQVASPYPDVSHPATVGRSEDLIIRALDVMGALLMIMALGWLFAAIALVVRLDSPGPSIFRQRRVGRGGRVFTVYKFRTMYVGEAEAIHAAHVRNRFRRSAQDIAERLRLYKLLEANVTRAGRVLRRTSLDELPQLWNVLRGEMSLVGPRPVATYEAAAYPDWYHERFQVKPGLTGLWQTRGRDRLTYEEMVRLDIEFVSRRSLAVYLAILAATVPALLFRRETA